MMEMQRPDPDRLLENLRDAEMKARRGRLRLFFGMAAGVGKTYAMLKAAQARKAAGVDVVVGLVETHGRKETEALLEGLPVIPRKKVEYRGTTLEETDLEGILARKPSIVLVDELAHTNAPGSRHPKRYQDVIDLLDAGIDVYSTMNVQHLESRVDTVRLITAVSVRETVPDSVLDLADEIELVDISPQELLKRFQEGKVYPGERAKRATQYFFQESHLTALREIALRATASKVEQELQGIMTSEQIDGPWSAADRLMVAISHSPYSENLIRSTRRMAAELDSPWVALYVDTGQTLSEADQNRLVKHLQLARELGAEVITTQDADIVAAILRIAKSRNVVQIVIGRPGKWRLRDLFGRGTLLDRLVREEKTIDVHVIRHAQEPVKREGLRAFLGHPTQFSTYVKTALFVAGLAVTNWFLVPLIGYQSIGFIFLFGVIIASLFIPFGPTIFAGLFSALVWNFFFIPPLFTFAIGEFEDVLMLITYFAVAMVTGLFANRVQRNQRILRRREQDMHILYDTLTGMTLARGVGAAIGVALDRLAKLFDVRPCVLVAEGDRLLEQPAFGELEIDEKQLAVAVWSFEHRRVAGWGTETLPLSPSMAVCLNLDEQRYGVLLLHPRGDRQLTPEQRNLLFVISNQITVALAKARFEDEKRGIALLQESEKLHQTLLNSISHELRTPLTAIMGAASALQDEKTMAAPGARATLTEELIAATERLNHVVENLLDMTRLESGSLKIKREWFDLSELVASTLEQLRRPLHRHRVEWRPPEHALYAEGDYRLLEHALSNVLLNAAAYSPPGSRIAVALRAEGEHSVMIAVRDEGPGIPEPLRSRVFDKFYRVPGSPSGGTGLGLSIAKSVVEACGGTIRIDESPQGGAEFCIRLPLRETPGELREEEL